MGSTVFPAPVSSSGQAAYSLSMPTANALYYSARTLSPGLYTLTSSSSVSNIYFYDGNTLVTSASVGTSPTLLNIGSNVTDIFASNPGGGASISVILTAASLTQYSGTFTTLTSSGTWNTLGKHWIVLVGGGGGGGGTLVNSGTQGSGGGGGSGGISNLGIVNITTPTSYVIGSAGIAGNMSGSSATNGGNTSFGVSSVTGGGAGGSGSGGFAAGGAAGSPNGVAGGGGNATGGRGNGIASGGVSLFNFFSSSTTGSGAGGWANNNQRYAGGSGTGGGSYGPIGSGGGGAYANSTAGQQANALGASGYGSGGGGAAHFTTASQGSATNGTQGCIFILSTP